MAVIDVNAVYEVIVKGSMSNQAVVNVFHYVDEEGSPPEPNETEENFLASFRLNWRSAVLPKVSNLYFVETYTLRRITGTEVDPDPPPPNRLIVPFAFQLPGTLDDAGDRLGEPLPTYAAAGYRKLTSNPTRNGRGSFRLGGLLEEDTTGGNALNAGALVLLAPATLEPIRIPVINPPGTRFMLMAVFSETLALVTPNVTPRNFAFAVNALALNGFVTSQVSRKQRVGSS